MPPSTEFRIFLKDKLEAFRFVRAAAAVLCVHGIAHADRFAERLARMVDVRGDHSRRDRGQARRQHVDESLDRHELDASFSIGVLMNTRGLVELVVLNIGYDLGILSGRIFAMMVLMALVTTFMTGPLLALVKIAIKGARRWQERSY
jgi:hypothetical protein